MTTSSLPPWPLIRLFVLQIPPRRLALFPFLTASVWFVTLAALLLTWIARGMPRYPRQGNPYVAFISDIASFELKPLFLVGASITAVCFAVTIAAVHVARYEYSAPPSSLNDTDPNAGNEEIDTATTDLLKSRTLLSLFSVLSAIVAALGLVLLGVMDTFRYHDAHFALLRVYFAGLALQAAGTVVVYAEEVVSFVPGWEAGRDRDAYRGTAGEEPDEEGKGRRLLRMCALASAFLASLELVIGITFIAVSEEGRWRTAGILEWIMAFLGTGYIGLFAGFLIGIHEEREKHGERERGEGEDRNRAAEDMDARERTPLLSEGRLEWTGLSH